MKSLPFSAAFCAALLFSINSFAQTESEPGPACSHCNPAVASAGCCNGLHVSPIILALDLDKDGEISALEIKNAVSSLSALDTDGNGKLTAKELQTKSQFSQVNAPVKSKLQLGVTLDHYVKQMLHKYDKNKNKQLEKSEMPSVMASMLDMIDTNKDGVLDENEMMKIGDSINATAPRPNAPQAKAKNARVPKRK